MTDSKGSAVKWESWGASALKRAKDQHKPIYLFIRSNLSSLSSEMEEHSFSNEEVIKILNEDFVPIKIDREEYPVLEEAASITCRVMNGSAGFPLNLFTTPDLKPFFAAGYMPMEGSPANPGMVDCLPRIKWLWLTENESVLKASEEIMEGVKKASEVCGSGISLEEAVDDAAKGIEREFDEEFGGFGEGIKVPMPSKLFFLEEYSRAFGEHRYDAFTVRTLDSMCQKAIRDHLGGGFFSLSKNRDWSNPLMEKRLAVQAMMALTFAEGFDRYGKVLYWRAADEALAYMSMDLYDPRAGFLAGQMAVSDDDRLYTWSEWEVDALLGSDGPLFRRSFCIEGDKSVPSMAGSLEEMALKEGFSDPEDLGDILAKGCQVLSSSRLERPHPVLDSRIFTDWNGLAIVALARCGRLMDRKNYVKLAERELSRFLEGEILHCHHIPAFLDDYAFLTWGAIELYRSTEDEKWLDAAMKLEKQVGDLFSCGHGYRVSSEIGDGLLFARSSAQDGTTPSGTSVMAGNLVSLWLITGEEPYLTKSRNLVKHFGGAIGRSPEGYSDLLTSVLRTMA